MGRVIRIALLIIVIVFGAALAAPYVIPADAYRDRIANLAEDRTGRRLQIDGDIRLRVLPRLQILAEDVTLSDIDGFDPDPLAAMDRFALGVGLFPLLSGRIDVSELTLEGADVRLEVDRNGQPNWAFGAGGSDESESEGGAAPSDLRLSNVRLRNSRVSYANAQTGAAYALENIDMRVGLDSLDDPLSLTGAADYQGERLSLETRIDQPRDFLAQTASPVTLSLTSALITAAFDGEAALAAADGGLPLTGSGQTDIRVDSIARLMDWLDQSSEDLPVERLEAEGLARFGGSQVAVSDASVTVDELQARGEASVALDGPRPRIGGDLRLDRLDLRPFFPESAGSGAAQAGGGGWSEAPFDFSPLKAADAELDLSAGEVITPYGRASDANLALDLVNGDLSAVLDRMALYGGQGNARFRLNARGATPALETELALTGIRGQDFLNDALNFAALSGLADLSWSASARGASQRAMMQSLTGSGQARFADGSFSGINLAAMYRQLQSLASLDPSALTGVSETLRTAGQAQQTDFAELAASFAIRNGQLSTDDLRLVNPFLRVNGQGAVNIPEQSLDVRLTPRFVTSAQGQGGEQDISGLIAPIRVRGGWNNLSFGPDASAIGRGLLESGALGEDAQRLSEDPVGTITGLIRGRNQDEEAEGESESGETERRDPTEEAAETLIRGLFGNTRDEEENGD